MRTVFTYKCISKAKNAKKSESFLKLRMAAQMQLQNIVHSLQKKGCSNMGSLISSSNEFIRYSSPALKLYIGLIISFITTVSPILSTISSIDLYAMGHSSSV